jgi:hypothetical protein
MTIDRHAFIVILAILTTSCKAFDESHSMLRSFLHGTAGSRELQSELNDTGAICNLPGTSCEASVQSCSEFDFEFCSVNCVDACQKAKFHESTVTCQDGESCSQATFRNSTVQCLDQQSCKGAEFFASAVNCTIGGDYPSCEYSQWYQCSCCLSSENCPVELCVDPQAGTSDEFCDTLVLGRTCKDWGNPICSTSVPSPTTRNPTTQTTLPSPTAPATTVPPPMPPSVPTTTGPPTELTADAATDGASLGLALFPLWSIVTSLLALFYLCL